MKPVVRLVGVTASLVALAFFGLYAHRALAGQNLGRLLDSRVVLAGGFLTVLYATLIPVTAAAWSRLLGDLGQPVRLSITVPLLAMTQFGKYLPGNVGHHLGRVLVAKSLGVGTQATLMSMAYETLLVVLACAHVGALTLLWSVPAPMQDWPMVEHRALVLVALTIGVVALLVLASPVAALIARVGGRADMGGMPRVRPGWTTSLVCYLLYALNFLIVGAGLFLVAMTLAPEARTLSLFLLLTGAFASSWLVGFMAPGAPAGLGVREAALAFWLHDTMSTSIAVALIVILRVATTVGDLLNFAWGSVWLGRLSAITTRDTGSHSSGTS